MASASVRVKLRPLHTCRDGQRPTETSLIPQVECGIDHYRKINHRSPPDRIVLVRFQPGGRMSNPSTKTGIRATSRENRFTGVFDVGVALLLAVRATRGGNGGGTGSSRTKSQRGPQISRSVQSSRYKHAYARSASLYPASTAGQPLRWDRSGFHCLDSAMADMRQAYLGLVRTRLYQTMAHANCRPDPLRLPDQGINCF